MNTKEIVDLLKKYEQSYYEGKPLVSDEEFDRIKDELRVLDPLNAYLDNVGQEDMTQSTFEKTSHGIYSMGSLDKVSNIEEFKKWNKSEFYPIIIDEKEDGSSIKVIYEKGNFKQAITRGNGIDGFDVTENVKLMDFPKTINIDADLVILRGEVIFTHNNYQLVADAIKKEGGDVSKSPRNLAAGLMKRKDNLKNLKYLTIRFYDVMNYKDLKTTSTSMKNILNDLMLSNYVTTSIVVKNENDLLDVYENYNTKIRSTLNRDIDGLVLTTVTGEKIAFKFPATIKQSTLTNVKWQVGISGRITPVGNIEPTELNGATVTNVSLYNIDYLNISGLKIGNKIGICRRGDVIPKIVDIYQPGTNDILTDIKIPDICPVCGGKLIIENKYLMCNNDDCEAKVVGKIVKWLKIHEVKDIGEGVIELLHQNEIFTSLIQFLYIEKGFSDEKILEIEGIGEKTLTLLKENIRKTLNTNVINFIVGLNIGGIDSKIIEKILENIDDPSITIESFIVNINRPNFVENIKGIGDITKNKLLNGIKNKLTEINLLKDYLNIKPYERMLDSKFSGKTFVVTGTLSKPRKHYENVIKENGGKFSSSITKDADYVLVGENAGSKLEKAKGWGLNIINENDFNSMI